MAWVRSVKIDQLAGRSGTLELSFQRHLNILWGVNGCGKTSLLKIIDSALRDEPNLLSRTPFKSAIVEFEDEANGTVYTRKYEPRSPARRQVKVVYEPSLLIEEEEIIRQESVEYEREPYPTSAEVSYYWRTDPKPNPSRKSFKHRYLPISRVASDGRFHRMYTQDGPPVFNEAAIDQQFAIELQRLWRDYYVREQQKISALQREGIAEILNSIVEPTSPAKAAIPSESTESVYNTLRSFFRSQRIPFELGTSTQFAKSYKTNEALRRVAHKVVEIQGSTLDISEPRRRAEQLLSGLFSGKKVLHLESLKIEVVDQRRNIPVQQLSSGERQILRMLVECLAIENNCILIDEPELSMHVDWQNKLIESMRSVNPSAQIIAATHSPEVMAEVSDESIYELVV